MGEQLHTYLWRKQPLQNKLSLLISFVLLLAHKRITVQVPFLLTKAITDLVRFQASRTHELLQTAVKFVVMFAGAQLVQQLLSEARTVLVVYTMQEARKQYSRELFQHVHALDTDVHLKTPSGEIISSVARGVKGMKALLQESIFILLPQLVEVSACLLCGLSEVRLLTWLGLSGCRYSSSPECCFTAWGCALR